MGRYDCIVLELTSSSDEVFYNSDNKSKWILHKDGTIQYKGLYFNDKTITDIEILLNGFHKVNGTVKNYIWDTSVIPSKTDVHLIANIIDGNIIKINK